MNNNPPTRVPPKKIKFTTKPLATTTFRPTTVRPTTLATMVPTRKIYTTKPALKTTAPRIHPKTNPKPPKAARKDFLSKVEEKNKKKTSVPRVNKPKGKHKPKQVQKPVKFSTLPLVTPGFHYIPPQRTTIRPKGSSRKQKGSKTVK